MSNDTVSSSSFSNFFDFNPLLGEVFVDRVVLVIFVAVPNDFVPLPGCFFVVLVFLASRLGFAGDPNGRTAELFDGFESELVIA